MKDFILFAITLIKNIQKNYIFSFK